VSAPLKFHAATLSDIGRIRQRNEDRCLLDEKLRLFGVADGVSGLPGGAEAAQTAVDSILAFVAGLPPDAEPDLAAAFRDANRAVLARGKLVNPGYGIATTLTAGRLGPAGFTIAHLGDSRCYVYENRRLDCLTEDHSVANEAKRLRLAGKSAAEFSGSHGDALVRYLGQPGEITVDVVTRPAAPGARYLFCTDGVTRMIPERQIGALFSRFESPERTVRELIDLALAHGGADNASAVILSLDG
jgi:protein phosphatase